MSVPSPTRLANSWPRIPIAAVLLLVAISGLRRAPSVSEPIALGSRLELFVDHALIDRLDGAALRLHEPVDRGPVLAFDRPWEGPFSGYVTVIHDADRYRLYYRGSPEAGRDGRRGEVLCTAESADGIAWFRPDLTLFRVGQHDTNNVVLADAEPVTHNFTPFLDANPDAPPEERFKGLGGTMTSGLMAFASADGIHWNRRPGGPVLTSDQVPFRYMFDSQNVSFWSPAEQRYVLYFRVFEGDIRRIARTTSQDFVSWTPSTLMAYRHDGSAAPLEQLYTNQTHPYFRAPHLYIATAARFMPGRQVVSEMQARSLGVDPGYYKDASDAVLLTSRVEPSGTAPSVYDRTFLEGFLRPGLGLRNWVSRTNYPALNVVRTGEGEMSLYVNQDYAQPTAHLRRYALRLDGFSSLHAGTLGGEMTTVPLTFYGTRLVLNFATSAAGAVRVELQDVEGNPIPGFEMEACDELIGNEISRPVSWSGRTDLSALAGLPVRMRLRLEDADVYSFQFAAP